MAERILLKVPAKPKAEFVSYGNFDAELVPGSTVETTDPQIADWLVSEWGLKEISRETIEKPVEEPAEDVPTPDLSAEYPEDFPSREALIEANVPFETVKTLDAEQLVGYKGIGAKSAAAIVDYVAKGGTE